MYSQNRLHFLDESGIISREFISDKQGAGIMLQYAFGGGTPQEIYEAISDIADDREFVTLNINKTCSSISMFDKVVFSIRINSRTQCLDTDNSIAVEYVPDIFGATQTKGTAHIPLLVDEESIPKVNAMVRDIYEQRRSQVIGDAFGCCNDHVRCSDAGYCLHLKDRKYWGCYYRKNLEAGRIFYGKNKNI